MQSNPYPNEPRPNSYTNQTPNPYIHQPPNSNEPGPNPYVNQPPNSYVHQPPTMDNSRTSSSQQRKRVSTIAKIIGYVGWAIAVLDVLLLLRFVFKLIGADPNSPFVTFLYAFTGFFVYIFKGIVANSVFGNNNQYIFEWSTLIAMAVYAILAWILTSFLRTRITPPEEFIQ